MVSNNLDKKLLAEALDAVVNDNDIAKATRLFKRHWDRAARNSYALLESANEDFAINDMGDDFNNEMVDEIGGDKEECYNQAQIAVDELEDKFPTEMTDEVKTKFDDLRNLIDELKLSEEGDDNTTSEDASVALEDLKGEFELAGELSEEVTDLFDEISACIQGDEAAATEDEMDVADEDVDVDLDNVDDLTEGEEPDLEFTEDEETDDSAALDDDLGDEEPLDEPTEGEPEGDKPQSELVKDIKYTADDLLALIDELEAADGEEGAEEDSLEEAWAKISDPRKKATSEDEGTNKKGTMNFGKYRTNSLSKAGLNTSSTNSKGTMDAKVKTQDNENKGAKQWTKVSKPENRPASSKSLLGK